MPVGWWQWVLAERRGQEAEREMQRRYDEYFKRQREEYLECARNRKTHVL